MLNSPILTFILILNPVQSQALDSLSAVYTALDAAPLPPLQLPPAHVPLARGVAWSQEASALAGLITIREEALLLVAMGREIAAWNEEGTALTIPGIPGLMPLHCESGPMPALPSRASGGAHALTGAFCLHAVAELLPGLEGHQRACRLTLLDGDPAGLVDPE